MQNTLHLYGISQLLTFAFIHIIYIWILFYPVRIFLSLHWLPSLFKDFANTFHLNGLECISVCLVSLLKLLKHLPHTLHLYGFSPVCVLVHFCRLPSELKHLSHTLHLYGFYPVCVLVCFCRLPDVAKHL